jgi:tRNA uridine 5-carbamoylmethylation protein Kti12
LPFAGYGARIRIAYVEVSRDELRRRNRSRPAQVPEKAIDRLLDRWEIPDLIEAHGVEFNVRA